MWRGYTALWASCGEVIPRTWQGYTAHVARLYRHVARLYRRGGEVIPRMWQGYTAHVARLYRAWLKIGLGFAAPLARLYRAFDTLPAFDARYFKAH
jgi:hypothetical protein